MMIAKAVFDAPSRSTSVCKGKVRWFLPAAVMTACLISTSARFDAEPHKSDGLRQYEHGAIKLWDRSAGWQPAIQQARQPALH